MTFVQPTSIALMKQLRQDEQSEWQCLERLFQKAIASAEPPVALPGIGVAGTLGTSVHQVQNP